MNIRKSYLSFSILVLLQVATGCKKSELEMLRAPLELSAAPPETALRVHWLGKKQLGTMASAYYVTRLWQLPESRQMEVQFLQKIAVAPWRLTLGEGAVSNAQPALFGPLVQDMIQEECLFELRQTTNGSEDLVFAIHLDEARAGVWRTNLVAVIASVAGIQTMDILDNGRGWRLRRPQVPNTFELARAGEWTVLGLSQEKNQLMEEVKNLVGGPRKSRTSSSNAWLTVDVDLARLRKVLPRTRGKIDNLPRIAFTVNGDGGNVLTHADLTFPKSLPMILNPWQIPTNLIREPVASFSAIRGLEEPLAFLNLWRDQFSTVPDQLFAWGLESNSFRTYIAFPLPNAGIEVTSLSRRLIEKANPWLNSHGYVNFEPLRGTDGLVWGDLPAVRPFFRSVEDSSRKFIFAGLLPSNDSADNPTIQPGLPNSILGSTNLVAYDWEKTGARLQADLEIGQLTRLILRRAQLPPESVSVNWMRSISSRLFESESSLGRKGTNQLIFERKSTIGFTGVELNYLADWLESPTFPSGLHSQVLVQTP